MSTDHTPFPALTPSQRLHLEIYGYVVLEKLLTEAEVAALLEVIYRIEADFQRTGQLPGASCHLSSSTREFFRIDNLPHLAQCFYEYLTHPRILGMAEEIVGGTVRLEQSDAHIRRPGGGQKYGFHRGINPAYSHTGNGLYHFSFVKALTNLTELGPDDGGTTVIPGTHKIPQEVDGRAIIDAALADPALVHQVEAPAGSTLLFYESLMHSSGIIRSQRDRVLILGGYTPTMFQAWNGYDPDPEFVAGLPAERAALLTGGTKYGWQRKLRDLAAPAETV